LQGKNFVWVVGEGNKASQRPIKVGARIDSNWLIEEGLKAGERIIVEGVQQVRSGAVVRPMTAAERSQTAAPPAAVGPKKEKE
jgi:membrane fusion protein, multidrug efflux system